VLELDLTAVPSGPRVVAVSPENEATGIARVTSVSVTFSKAVNPVTLVAPGAVLLLDTNNAPLQASVSLNLAGNVLTLLPTSSLPPSQRLRLRLSGDIAEPGGDARMPA
jgi:hypothetical protein